MHLRREVDQLLDESIEIRERLKQGNKRKRVERKVYGLTPPNFMLNQSFNCKKF